MPKQLTATKRKLISRDAAKHDGVITSAALQAISNRYQTPQDEVRKLLAAMGYRFERAPAPDDDGEVLILQFDSKGAPTATQTELERRRLGFQRKRAPLQSVLSQTRHYKGSGYGPIMRRTDDLRGGRRS